MLFVNKPLGGAWHLFERWLQLCGHFERLLGVHSHAMNASGMHTAAQTCSPSFQTLMNHLG